MYSYSERPGGEIKEGSGVSAVTYFYPKHAFYSCLSRIDSPFTDKIKFLI